jgi:1,5-anhydro-D-fructose reductase (1,5-anhydro-D-mannitol-forming)
MPKAIRVAVLGFWHVHAGDYAARAVEHPETELVAVWDSDVERGRDGAAEFGVEHVTGLEALLARTDLDGVLVTTATSDHRDLMTTVARAGLHIFTEKVLAPTVAECEEIVAAVDDAGVTLVVSLPRLYHGSTTAIRRVLDSGRLGELSYCRVRLSHDGAVRRADAPTGWLPERFFDPAYAVGGALTDLGAHPVYLAQLFAGREPDTVSATYRSLTGRAVEDHAVVTLGYSNGRIAVVEAGFVSDEPFVVELHGTDGSLHYSSRDGLRVDEGSGWVSEPVPPDDEDAFGQWVQHIRAGTRADDNVARAVELTRLVEAANSSARTRSTVHYRIAQH